MATGKKIKRTFQRKNICISKEDYKMLQNLSNGNASAGLRRALQLVREFQLGNTPKREDQ